MTFGNDFSEDFFTIDNPGNAAPLFTVFTPQNNDTVSDMYDITWFARDVEFQDSLFIDILFKSQYSSSFNTVALNEPNDSLYSWHTIGLRNGSGTLIVQVSDDSNTVAETLQIYVLNQISAATASHISGLNNCVELSILGHVPSLITGHTYEVQFRVTDNDGNTDTLDQPLSITIEEKLPEGLIVEVTMRLAGTIDPNLCYYIVFNTSDDPENKPYAIFHGDDRRHFRRHLSALRGLFDDQARQRVIHGP